VVYVLVSLLFGVISGVLAHHKARNALGWAVAGCLVGPFGLVVWLLPMAQKDGVTKVCPRCSETIRIEAKVCRYCRSDLRGITKV
jgi:ribosomal protein L40E